MGALLGVLFAGVLIGIGVEGAAFVSGADLPTLPAVAGGVLVFAALEWRVRRASSQRLAPGVAMLRAVVAQVEPIDAGWYRGLPFVRGVHDGHKFAVHLEAKGEALRVGVALDLHTDTPWVASADRPGYPGAWLDELVADYGFSWVEVPPPARVVARDVEAASAALADGPGAEAVALTTAATAAATVEVGAYSARWDVALDDAVDAALVLRVARVLGALDQGPETDSPG